MKYRDSMAVMGAVAGTSFWLGLSAHLEGAQVTTKFAIGIFIVMVLALVLLFYIQPTSTPHKNNITQE